MCAARLVTHHLDELEIVDDEEFAARVPHYRTLKRALAHYPFVVLPKSTVPRFDHTAFLNLTYWSGTAGDVLVDRVINADVVAHVGWHHVVHRALPTASVGAALLGEAIASAFDLFMLGHLLNPARGDASASLGEHTTSFVETQLPEIADVATQAGLTPRRAQALVHSIVADPSAAFEHLRRLLFDVSMALAQASDTASAHAVLVHAERDPFAVLLHRYELSNWVLSSRARPAADLKPDMRALELDAQLRGAASSIDWLATHLLAPCVP